MLNHYQQEPTTYRLLLPVKGLCHGYMEVGDPKQVRLDEAGHPTYYENVIKLHRNF